MRVTEKHWVGGSAAVALLLLVGTWLLAISPVLDAAAATRAEVTAVEARNELLRTELTVLRQRYQDLDRYRSDLSMLREQIPVAAHLAENTQRVAERAQAHGATIVSIEHGTPLDVVPAATATSAPGEVAPEATGDDAATPAATSAAIPGFVAVPVEIVVLGATPSTLAFLADLQSDASRLFLVGALTATGQDGAPPSGGRPATAEGDVELTISGYVYVLRDASTDGAGAAPGTEAGTRPAAPGGLPVPDPSRERFSVG